MKQKKLYINRYNFYAFNCSLILWTIIFLASCIIPILSIHTSEATSIGIIGGADGPTAIYVASKLAFLSFLIALIGIIALWLMLFINYMRDKDKIKSMSIKRILVCACLSVVLIIITNSWLLGLWTLSLGIIMLVLWNSKKFEVSDKEEVK
jgi:Na+-transporting methylmalonyl-CoA/oxaloacetate decarboxylase beta subunit